MKDFKTAIAQIGRKMVKCTSRCTGITRNRHAGRPPRCLILELQGRTSSKGCAVIGINPGNADPKERKFYGKHGTKYSVLLKYWTQDIGYKHTYYSHVRNILDQVGLSGPILWTELAKCEGATKKRKVPPLSTLRHCAAQFLLDELQLVPQWPLIALGREAQTALSYMFPRRTIIAIPHPTGTGGRIQYSRMMPGGVLSANAVNSIRRILAAKPGIVAWISHKSR